MKTWNFTEYTCPEEIHHYIDIDIHKNSDDYTVAITCNLNFLNIYFV